MTRIEDDRTKVALKRPWPEGTTAIVQIQRDLMERVVAQIPRPREHTVLYDGILSTEPSDAAKGFTGPRRGEKRNASKPVQS